MRTAFLLVAAGVALAACSTTDSRPGPGATGGTVIMAPTSDASSIFPPSVFDLTGRMVQDQLFDRLAEIGPELVTIGDKDFTPRLAKSWTWASDSLSIAFSLDPRARWHDDKPVTAGDVRFSFKVYTDPKFASPVAPLLANLDSVTVRDSLTAVVWFKKHTPEQFYDVAYQLVPIPEHVYGGIPLEQLRTSPITQSPVGNSRFRFVRWDKGTRIELVADTSNYRGRAKLDRIVFTPSNPVTAATQLLTGQADFVESYPFDRASELDTSTVARAVVLPNFAYVFMAMNQFDPKSKNAPHPIFSDVRVRRALSMAVDRRAMLTNVFGDKGKLSYGPFAMSAPFADSTLRLPPYDTAAAKALLDSAGWRAGANGMRAKNGRPLRFALVVSPSPFRRRYAVLMQEQFKTLGVQMDLDQVDDNAARAHMDNHDFDALMGAFSNDPSPSGVRQTWGTDGIAEGGQNFLRYSNKRFDTLLDSATSSFDPAKMKSYASRAFQTVIDDAPAIFLYDITLVYGVNRRITMAPTRTDEYWANLADWSIPAGKRIDRDRIGLTPAKP